MTESSGAQAIYKPMPEIPDELRDDALNASAVVRFHVAVDGTATVELLQPTQYPQLNRLLLDTLRKWKFFPAIRDGQPVASDFTQPFRFQVQ
jgi:protein TonB